MSNHKNLDTVEKLMDGSKYDDVMAAAGTFMIQQAKEERDVKELFQVDIGRVK